MVGPLPLAIMALIASATLTLAQTEDAETRVLNYIRDNLRPGQPLLVSELYNNVFTQPEERKALDKLYRAFFRIPLFLAQYQEKYGHPPYLQAIAEQFQLRGPDAAKILLRVMEADPRVPRFVERDPETGRITHVDIERIRSDARFGQVLQRQLAAWQGKPAPPLRLTDLSGREIDSAALQGKVALLYIWFTGCPTCVKETGALARLGREFAEKNFVIVAANADRLLGLDYDDDARRRSAGELSPSFPVVHWTPESDEAYGSITIFPTMFLVDREGTITHHWIGFLTLEKLRQAVLELLGPP